MAAAAPALHEAAAVSLQLQQPPDSALAAARAATGLVVLDGAPAGGRHLDELLSLADVVRADAQEAELLTGRALSGVDDARDVAPGCSRAVLWNRVAPS